MPDTITPDRLATALDGRRGIKMLSLDCFDTLLWRDVHAPTDLFERLEEITPAQRIRAERAARKRRILSREPSAEVTLREIYAELFPDADDATRDTYVDRELMLEARHCYAFAPTVALMREARRRGMKIVVVSDTYLECDQLAWLIRTAAGAAVADLIDQIFCSSTYRSAKGEKLFNTVLRATSKRPDHVLHIGDNRHADLASAQRHGLQALHLVQFSESTTQRLRQNVAAGAMLMPFATAMQPYRAAVAIGEPVVNDAGEALGFGVLGPIFLTFAQWIIDEAAQLANRNPGKVHQLYLMRDGHLPAEIVTAAQPGVTVHKIEISRFTATAAAMRDPDSVRKFVRDEIADGAGIDFLRQLLITGEEATALIAASHNAAGDPALALCDTLLSDAWLPRICGRAQAFAHRLTSYVRSIVKPAPGDTIMLIDLGYNATVQNRVESLLREAFAVEVAGRYLLLEEQMPSGLDKRGLIGPDHFAPNALFTLTSSIAIVEQFATVSQGSVVDYTDDGAPIRAAIGIKGRQSDVRDAVQRGCIAFASVARDATVRAASPGMEMHRPAVAAALARLLYLPLPHELALLDRFEHDSNLGSDEKSALFDAPLAARGLRENGLFYLNDAKRLYLPAELRGQGLATSLMLLAKRRFSLDLRYADFCDRDIAVPVLVTDGTEAFADTVRATPTHDGWFVAAVPVGACRYTVGLQFGRDHEWLQIESARFLPVGAFLAGQASADNFALPALPSCEGMEQTAPYLFHCTNDEAFLMVPPPEKGTTRGAMMLAVVFRPVAPRERADPALARSSCLEAFAK